METKEILNQEIKTIKALGEKSKLAIIPREFILPWLILISISYLLYKPMQIIWGVSEGWLIIIIVWLCTAWSLIAGRNSHNFTDEFYPLPGVDWIDLPTSFFPATDRIFSQKMTRKLQPVVERDLQGNKSKYYPFQNESELHGIMKISIGDHNFAVILRCNNKLEWSATIPFSLSGLHPQMDEAEIINQSEAISNALLDIPQGENITFVIACRSRAEKRKAQLTQLITEKQPIMGILLESEKLRVEQTTQSGWRQEWHHYALVTWSQRNQALRQNTDTISTVVNGFKNLWGEQVRKLIGTDKSYWRDIYISLAEDIYNNCYLPWKIRLESKGKLSVSSLTPTQIWSDLLSKKFRETASESIPQLINVFIPRQGKPNYEVVINNQTNSKDLISQLIEGELGRSGCPAHNSRRDRVKVKNELIGILNLVKPPESVRFGAQLYWLWSKIKDPTIRDIEVFLELNPGDSAEARTNLVRLVKQSSAANAYAQKKRSLIDVAATELSEQALEAQKRLQSGAQPLLAALSILVYRQTDAELNSACTYLEESFAPAFLLRERKVCWKRWLETLPINNHSILGSTQVFSERRPTVDTISVRSLLPLIRPQDIHQDGVEFIVSEGGYPVYLNLVENSQRAIITGKSGSGKTVMSFGHIKQALYREDRAVVGIDMSNAGESTLQPITELLGAQGAFINLSESSYNVLQPPDLRRLEPKERQKRLKIWLDSRRQIIVSLALGTIIDAELLENVTAIVTLTLDVFFRDPEIVQRYNQAWEQGWQSPAWQKMPVLEDFLFFCSREKLGLTDFGDKQARALEQIVTNISAKLVDPNIGDCISRPSTISPYARLQFFGLSGLNDENNAYILSLVAQGACLNTSLEYEKSLVVIDECPALFAKKGFAEHKEKWY